MKACVLFLLFTAMLLTPTVLVAQCKEPDSAKMAEVVGYVVKKYQIGSTASLTLTGSAKANDTCFWKLQYSAASPKRDIVLYLSPDRKYLVPLLYDMGLDPVVEMRAKNDEFSHELTAGASPPLGPAVTPVTIVEFSDFQCPFCKRMADVLEKEVLPKQAGKLNIVFRNFPLSVHPWAKRAAEIAECAELQQPEAFWAMHDFFFQNQQALQLDTLEEKATTFAATLKGLDKAKFSACVDRELGLGPVTLDQKLGDRIGVHGTPTLFINGVRFDGLRTGDEINMLVERADSGELVAPPETLAAVAKNGPGARPSATECAPVGGKLNGR